MNVARQLFEIPEPQQKVAQPPPPADPCWAEPKSTDLGYIDQFKKINLIFCGVGEASKRLVWFRF